MWFDDMRKGVERRGAVCTEVYYGELTETEMAENNKYIGPEINLMGVDVCVCK